MKNFDQWIVENTEKKDSQGGIVPQDMDAAKKADLITLPPDVPGTNCFNCKWIKKESENIGHCNHPKVDQQVNDRNCCAFWDNSKVKRPWKGDNKFQS